MHRCIRRSVRAIAAELGRSPSTVSREIAATSRSCPTAAGPTVRTPPSAARTPANRAPSPARSARTPGLRDFLQDHVTRRWSPEQIWNSPTLVGSHCSVRLTPVRTSGGQGERRALRKPARTGRPGAQMRR
ncbi:helix-turn-helix domain-containing protein [Streptomyces sp. NPDC048106]|uniref:helix-turn-helix domain-containing protein n=1 Tax=Streptomyces sp. NPDC048106 TaxID=3155750 RepID=UPI003453236B